MFSLVKKLTKLSPFKTPRIWLALSKSYFISVSNVNSSVVSAGTTWLYKIKFSPSTAEIFIWVDFKILRVSIEGE